jgi:hypothetical protein
VLCINLIFLDLMTSALAMCVAFVLLKNHDT